MTPRKKHGHWSNPLRQLNPGETLTIPQDDYDTVRGVCQRIKRETGRAFSVARQSEDDFRVVRTV